MNKQELIEKYEKLEGVCKDPGAEIARLIFLEDLRELDELQKVQVPQFVADWYEEHKDDFEYNLWEYLTDWEEQEPSDFKNWINDEYNTFQTLVNMHQFGYTVEKEKRYLVKMKGVVCPYLNYDTINELWFYNQKIEGAYTKTKHTRKELEESGFGEVFNSPLFEVEEVEG